MDELGGRCYKCGFRGHHAYQCRNIVNGAEMALDVSSTSSEEDDVAAAVAPGFRVATTLKARREDRSRSPVDKGKRKDRKSAKKSKEEKKKKKAKSPESDSSASSREERRKKKKKKSKTA